MAEVYEIPDHERRSELENARSRFKRALGALREVSPENHPAFEEGISETQNRLRGMVEEIEDELDEMPEWDRELAQTLVLENAKRSDTTVERVDNEVVIRFTVGPMGDETECRYAVAVGSGNEWFHVDNDGDWDEVWSN